MKQNKDWTDVMRSALRDAEVTPPADGWARLERELKEQQEREAREKAEKEAGGEKDKEN